MIKDGLELCILVADFVLNDINLTVFPSLVLRTVISYVTFRRTLDVVQTTCIKLSSFLTFCGPHSGCPGMRPRIFFGITIYRKNEYHYA